ncbi:hypothetical protein C343_06110 [Cryptococcus neoformans C23]|uniref:Conserved oligomeric Golgi complex subunit 5 n=1 Tax=Cryptococcus neoformans (strain H99 / ATCC 208821 / CBS 10515 / FGSC 9487) TaxID=235443 RepID=J9VX47_CRYN9|nr:hypothetical protein CNAG_01754 [Cryptococcus neoformans var. grubii H99]AUB28039.1 hypothetical protein CKF44_01754 [Cryptococcus neoformans var. grubii]OWZ27722.1 hypothetical protein C347_06149 [Cryptococcus neoformans var. grubii AD2-60a]OWZ40026.1 hypothetical protein C343_06110 [Cryptococcus neoformans var. grubii C23]OXC81907.1 hypothetical protein C344_05831 [Cryptococcus neoformans var. grubii AD1-7a]OXG27678.1 hypothetical protein C360_06477 [Cryptococcus neoformans var. grubii Bt|eukprot:XP_012052441.1 hypothetical protein CNAG_01754 [Cryptococcus neoformans var. grubii H99]
MPADTFLDHKPFLSDSFDVHSYTNAILQGRQYTPDQPQQNSTKEDNDKADPDVGAELARLNYGIEDVTKQLRQEITASHLLLLNHLTTSLSLSSHLSPIRSSLISLSASIDRLHSKIHTPYTNLSTLVRRQQNLRQIKDIARRASRFVTVARRLENQLERMGNAPEEDDEKGKTERRGELAKAALSCAELDSLLRDQSNEPGDDTTSIPLLDVDFIKAYSPLISRARDTVIEEMEAMIFAGLQELNQTLLSSALQTAHNLRLLPDLVSNLLDDLNDAVTLRVTKAFDVTAIGKEVAIKDGNSSHGTIKFPSRSRPPTEPTSSTTHLWVSVLWKRLERVIDDVANCCIKVYTLEKVLRIKRDTLTQVEFFDEVMKRLDEKPSFTYWTTLAKAFETQTKEAAKTSSWLQQALSVGYPRLLRLFHDFFSKIAVHTDTVYTQEHQSPEAVLVLRSISSFETLYLSRSTNRMSDAVASAVEQYLSARGNPPGPSDGVSIARTMTNELDSARFDPLLVRTVARNAAKILDGFIQTVDGMLIEDFTAISLIGPNATSAQLVNAQLVGCLYHCWLNLVYAEHDLTGKVWDILSPSVNSLETTYRRITKSLDAAFRKEITSTLSRIHRVNFDTPVDPLAMGMDARGGSPYMQDLVDKIGFIRSQILGRMSLGEYMKAWVLDLSKFIVRTFLLHASIARPMGESGALKLTGDMTELEMGVTNLLSTGKVQGAKDNVKVEQVGDEYFALRTFRTLLFANLESLVNPVDTVHIPPLIVLHHIIVRSPLRLPHEVHGWSESEYVLWIEKHKDAKEQWELVEKSVEDQDATNNEGEMKTDIYIKLIKELLAHARHDEPLSA